MHVEVAPVPFDDLNMKAAAEASASVRERVIAARERQIARLFGDPNAKGVHANAQMSSPTVRRYCELDEAGQQLIKMALVRLGLSARAFDRILKVARTIADLAASERISPEHLAEAIQYRSLDRASWAG